MVTMQGKPVTLVGDEIKVGQKAPEFEVVDNDLKPLKFPLKGKVCLILSVPSLDTSVCSKETHRFNLELAKFGKQVAGLTVSMDLPFAQKRWCAAEGATNLQTASDHKLADFGQKYGVLIKEVRLLARGVFIVDAEGVTRYVYLCKEIASEPPYDEVLKELTQLLSGVK